MYKVYKIKLLAICLLVCAFNLINASCINTVLQCEHSHDLNLDVSMIKVYFYKNNTERMFPINEATNGILSIPNLNRASKLFVYVSGFKSHIKSKSVLKMKKALTELPNSYLIIIDHSAYTHNNGWLRFCKITMDYKRSVDHVYYIGQRLAVMLAELSRAMFPPKNMHCMGHSLGGQILGHVGEKFYNLTGHKIARITALDPAGPCFDSELEELQVRSGVAEYVEVYHCNANILGSNSIIADVDFFVNNGNSQPVCGNPLTKDKCSHEASVNMWAKSTELLGTNRDSLLAFRCENYRMFKDGKCSNNRNTTAGFWNPGSAKGIYYFSTKHIKF